MSPRYKPRWLRCAVRLKNLPVDARPREKLLARGAAALSETELLALTLRSCIHCKNVLQLAQELMNTFGCLAGLLHAPRGARVHKRTGGCRAGGAGRCAGAVAAGAGTAAGRKAAGLPPHRPYAITLSWHLVRRPHEIFAVLFLHSQHRLITLEEMFRGTLTQILKTGLALVHVQVLDHFVVTRTKAASMAELGLV